MQVSLSSLNRHALATRADVGLPKAEVLKVSKREIFGGAPSKAMLCDRICLRAECQPADVDCRAA